MTFETVIGLEVHAELSTKSKIFCGCSTRFGGAPNTHVCPVCTGMPGSLPVFNRAAADFAIRAGLALNCGISRHTKFDRKNYFYPDLPKAYQVSQLYLPICRDGWLDIETCGTTKRIGIHEIHMEEDAGKLIHDPWEDCSLIDYNRCGVPLIEIVSEADFRSADEVIAYLEKLREILLFLGVCDCKMQEGSMRADVNLSVRPSGSAELGTRTEMKNMNSFKAIHRAVIYEAARQAELIETGGNVVQETRRWDDNKDASFAMRTKENAQDYRYFPEPDLLPLEIDEAWLARIKDTMPELAENKRRRYVGEMGITEYDAAMLTTAKPLSDLFEQTSAICKNPKETANLITGALMRLLNDTGTLPEDLSVDAAKLADLILLIQDGVINRNVGKAVLEELFRNGTDPRRYVEKRGLAMIRDDNFIEAAVDEALAANGKSVEDYRSGKEKAFGFLVGQTMKALKGKGDPQIVNRILLKKLSIIQKRGD